VSNFLPPLSDEGAKLVELLRSLAIENEVLCINAPVIWDAETLEDARTAIEGCNGKPADDEGDGFPPCPIKDLCLKTGEATFATVGVWGGKDFGSYPKRKKLYW